MRPPAIARLNWPRVAELATAAIEAMEARGAVAGPDRLAAATRAVLRELGLKHTDGVLYEFVESTVQHVFDGWRAGKSKRDAARARDAAKAKEAATRAQPAKPDEAKA